MRIVVFGASGRTGQEIVRQLLLAGHQVTAFVRSPEKLQVQSPRLRIAKGDVLDEISVLGAIRGQQAVISVLGRPTADALLHPNQELSKGVASIIKAMKLEGVKRFILVSSFGAGSTVWWPEKLFLRLALHNLFDDPALQERLVRRSKLDWTILRPTLLTSAAGTGSYTASSEIYVHPFSHIARADVAACIRDCLHSPSTVHQTLTVTAASPAP